ncbi:MAG TPA: nitroreductase/quinone reductase family protein [Candidatus Dormibacteraeota bacterium]|nr:nitroreductase/quinone reductase family protein [Candidatus Dormibacteraeota bacterium]
MAVNAHEGDLFMGIDVPPPGTRGSTMPHLMNRLFAPFMKMQMAKYRRTKGSEQPQMMGFPALLLTTVGAKSGQRRTVPLGGFPDGPDAWLVVGSAGGGARHPAWFINMAQHPDQIWVEVGSRKLHVSGASLRGVPRQEALQRIATIAPRYAGYQKKTDRESPSCA